MQRTSLAPTREAPETDPTWELDPHTQQVIDAVDALRGSAENPAALEVFFGEFEHIKLVLQRKFPRASPELVDEATAQAMTEIWRKLKADALPALKNPTGYFWKLALWRFQSAFERQSHSSPLDAASPLVAAPAPTEPLVILEPVYERCKKRHRYQHTLTEAWELLKQIHQGTPMKTLLERDGFRAGNSIMRVERDRRYQIIRRLRVSLARTARSFWKDDELTEILNALHATRY